MEDRELDSDEILLLSKKEQKEYKKNQKQKQLIQKYWNIDLCCDILKKISLNHLIKVEFI